MRRASDPDDEVTHDVRLLRSFLVVADEQHFGRAAERLHVSQPALTQRIQRLEAQLGLRLFQRGRGGATLTADGEATLRPARTAAVAARAVDELAGELREGRRGQLAIGYSPGAHLVVQGLLERLNSTEPGIRVRALQQSSRALASDVAAGRLDLAFGFCTGEGPGYRLEHLLDESAVVAVADTHRLAAEPTVHLSALADETFALVDEHDGPGYNAAIVARCRASGFEPTIGGEDEGPMAWETAVRAGTRIGLTTRSTGRSSADGLRLLELDPPARFPIELILHNDGPTRPAVRRLADLARAMAATGARAGHGHA